MSLEAITWAYKIQVGSPTRKAVLLVLANYADEDDSAFPSANRIAAMTELANSTVRVALDDLQEMGVIKARERRTRGKDGGATSNRYLLDLSWEPPAGSRQGGCSEPAGGVPGVGTRDTKSYTEEGQPTHKPRARRAERVTPTKPARKSRGGLRVVGDDDADLASNAFPAEEVPEQEERTRLRPVPRPRKLSAIWLAHCFDVKAQDVDIPHPQRVGSGGLTTNLAKWHKEGTRYEDIEAAMQLFFVSPHSHHRGNGYLWLSFVNALPDLLTRVTRKSMHDPDYYSDQKKENREMTREEYLEHLNAELR